MFGGVIQDRPHVFISQVVAQVGRTVNFVGYETPEFLRRMDAIGVEKLMICAIKTWSFHHQRLLENSTVEEVAALTAHAPKRLFGLYGVNVHQGMKGVAEFERAVREFGFRGFHLHPHGYGLPPNHAFYFPYYAKAQELKVPAIVSMGHTLDLMPNEPGRPMHLDTVALYFPDLEIVCTHTGAARGAGPSRLERCGAGEVHRFARPGQSAVGNRLPPHRPQGIAEPDRSAGP